jgi:archaellum component FlaF (FlaF/FlaG flagellin family)
MKTKCTYLFVAAFIAAVAPLKAVNSELSISTSDYSKFVLTVDNYYFGTPSTTFNVTNLSPGYHRVRMQRQGVLVNGRSIPMEQVYDGYINVPMDSRVIAVSPGSGALNIVSVISLFNNNYGGGCGTSTGYDPWGNNGGNNNGNNNGGGWNNGGYGNGGYGNNNGWYPPAPVGMLQADFDALKASINSKSFESTKLTVVMQALQNNRVSARQVKELMDLMTFESTKLDVAKYAYGKTVDRQNYYLVNDAFGFESSSTELARYINSYQGS